MNGLHRTPDQIKHRQELCRILSDVIHYDRNGEELLEVILDEYIYKCNEDEIGELEKLIAEYDDEPGYLVK